MTENARRNVKIGVIGTGYLGRLHARVLTEIPEADVVGFVEPRDEVAAEVEQSLSLRRWDSLDALAAEIECAVVATPTVHHFETASALMRAGCDVMVEKPITATAEEGRKLIAMASELGRVVQVGHVERYNPAIVAAAPLLQSPRYVEAQRIGVFSNRSLDIDVLLDLMIHDLHLVISLLGRPIREIRAIGVPVLTEKIDIANVRLEFDDGSVANLIASRVSSDRVRKFRVFGRDSYISVDTKEQEVKGYRLVKSEGAPAILPLDIQVERKEPLRAELESFLDVVRTRSRPLVAGEDGLAALELALRVGKAIDESLNGS